MVLSMTGYGRAEQERSGRDITVEIKSVNSRYFEYTSRMPRSFAFLDDKLKKLVNATISRGKTELALTVVNIGAPEASISVNLDLAKGYHSGHADAFFRYLHHTQGRDGRGAVVGGREGRG